MTVHVTKTAGSVNDQRSISQLLDYMPNGDYVISIETRTQWARRQGRSSEQNRLLWAFLADIARLLNNQYGDDYWNTQNLHDYICSRFAVEQVTPDGEVWSQPLSTSRLSKAQFTELLKRIQAWLAAEHGCNVPLPDDDNYIEFRQFMELI